MGEPRTGEIGGLIRLLRQQRKGSGSRVRHMTIDELAEKAELSPNFIAKLEQGKHSPSADALMRIARALEVAPGDLFPRTDGESDPERELALAEMLAFLADSPAKEIRHFIRILQAVRERD